MAGIQSSGERRALHAAWKAHPQVLGLEAALARHVRERGPVVSEVSGINDALAFARRWIAENGALPDDGIRDF